MTTKPYVMSLQHTKLLLAMIPVAFLTACSNFSELTQDLLKHAEEEAKVVKVAAIVETRPELPELPANLKRCLSQSKQAKKAPGKQAPKGKGKQPPGSKNTDVAEKMPSQAQPPSADALVLAQLEAQKRRQACADQILKWYDQLRRQQVAAK